MSKQTSDSALVMSNRAATVALVFSIAMMALMVGCLAMEVAGVPFPASVSDFMSQEIIPSPEFSIFGG